MAIYIFILQHLATNLCSFTHSKGPVIIYGGGGGMVPKRNVFRGKKFTDPTIKKSKI